MKINEDTSVNSTGSAVPGTGDTGEAFPKGPMRIARRGKFAQFETFIVSSKTYNSIKHQKKKGVHWKRYLEEDDAYHDLREYARKKRKGPIIIEDERTGCCMFVRYGEGSLFEAVENKITTGARTSLSDAGKKGKDVRRETKINYGKEKYLGKFRGHFVRKTSHGQGDAAYHLEDPKTGDITHSVNGSERKGVLTIGGASSTGKSKIKMHDFYHHLIHKHVKALVGTNQSEGAKKVWQKLAKKKSVNVHGWLGGRKGKAVNLDPQDEMETHGPAGSYNKRDRRDPSEKEAAATKLVAIHTGNKT